MDINQTVAKSLFADCRCDKCGDLVPFENNAVLVDMEINGVDIGHLFAQGRHLMPVYEDGVMICPGSPSRAQYIKGQPRDTRGSYPYRLEDEAEWREAYARVLLKYGAESGNA
ncbi:MAG: hypothetical protein AB203_00140 [Parcubacteria bacterium C7867-008]|nr:MAG: hypothetical protein AB203_00140 [Parcubacteria bacterium C7867-008]